RSTPSVYQRTVQLPPVRTHSFGQVARNAGSPLANEFKVGVSDAANATLPVCSALRGTLTLRPPLAAQRIAQWALPICRTTFGSTEYLGMVVSRVPTPSATKVDCVRSVVVPSPSCRYAMTYSDKSGDGSVWLSTLSQLIPSFSTSLKVF